MSDDDLKLRAEFEALLGRPVPERRQLPRTEGLLGTSLTLPAPSDAPPPPDEGRQERLKAAREVLRRVPEFLRDPKRAELERRLKEPSLLEASRSWSPDLHGNLALIGPSDIGKTTTAGIVFRTLLAQGVAHGGPAWERASGLWWVSATELEHCRETHPRGAGDPPLFAQACRASVLVIDDVGYDRDNKLVLEVMMFRSQRVRARTIVTGGLTIAELERHYGGAGVRKILEMGAGLEPTIVDCFH
jgi:DNA replication protein DnaC